MSLAAATLVAWPAGANPPGAPAGVQFLVNQTVVGSQTAPATASDAAGNRVFVWEQTNGSQVQVMARCYDASGAPRGGQFSVPSSNGVSDLSPAVAMGADGRFLVAWSRVPLATPFSGTSPMGHLVKARRFNPDCTPTANEFDVSSTPSVSDARPAVAMNAAGAAVVAWEAISSGEHEIRVRRILAGGTPTGLDIAVDNTLTGGPRQPAVGIAANGNFAVAWAKAGDILVQRYNSAGAPSGAATPVNATTAGEQSAPALAMAPGGQFVVAWQSLAAPGGQSSILARRFSSAGVPFAEMPVEVAAHSQWLPVVAVDGLGNYAIAWQQSDPANENIWFKRYEATGGVLRPAGLATANTFARANAAASMDADGDLVVAWSSLNEDQAGGSGVFASRFSGFYNIDLAMTKTVSTASELAGVPFTFTLTAAHLGSGGSTTGIPALDAHLGNADVVTITDSIPAAVTPLGFTTTDPALGCAIDLQLVTCVRTAALKPGQSTSVTLQVQGAYPDDVNNIATVSSANSELATGNNDESAQVTILPGDQEPDTVAFESQLLVPVSSVRTSNTVTIAGLTVPAPITIMGGSYSIGCTATFVTGAGSIANGQTLCLRRTAPNTPDTTVVVQVQIGPSTFSWTLSTAPDSTPAPFAFPAKNNVPANSLILSNAPTITGISPNVPVSITGGQFSVGCTGTFQESSSTISNNQTVCVRVRSPNASSATASTTLTIGTESATFTVTTADTVPGAFAFNPQTEVPPGSLRTSNSQTIGGITGPAPVTVGNNGSYSIGCTGTFVSSAGTISNGQTICMRRQAPLGAGVTALVPLTIGGVTANWSITTAHDQTPNAFSFGAQNNLPLGSLRTSNTVNITGISTAVPVSVANGSYSVGCTGTFVTSPGTIANNQSVCLQRASAPSPSTTVTVTLNVGTATGTWNLTTADDTTPDAFSFTPQTGVPAGSVRTSNPATIKGISVPVPISVSAGGAYSVGCSGEFTGDPGMISNNTPVCLQRAAPATAGATVTTTLTVGAGSASWSVTTAP